MGCHARAIERRPRPARPPPGCRRGGPWREPAARARGAGRISPCSEITTEIRQDTLEPKRVIASWGSSCFLPSSCGIIRQEASGGSQITKNSSKSRSPSGACASTARLDLSERAGLAKRENGHILLVVVSCRWSVVRCRRRIPLTPNPDRSSSVRLASFQCARILSSGGLRSSRLGGGRPS